MSTSQECLVSAEEQLENDPSIDSLIYSMFQDIEESDMATYWIDFMLMVEILMMNVRATTRFLGKTQNHLMLSRNSFSAQILLSQ